MAVQCFVEIGEKPRFPSQTGCVADQLSSVAILLDKGEVGLDEGIAAFNDAATADDSTKRDRRIAVANAINELTKEARANGS